jgi:hypothetical protein
VFRRMLASGPDSTRAIKLLTIAVKKLTREMKYPPRSQKRLMPTEKW